MKFDIEKSIEILSRTPSILQTLLQDLSEEWILNNEGDETWSPYDVIGHLIHGEKTDWIPRAKIILSQKADKRFKPFDRFAQFKESRGKNLSELLNEFVQIRKDNLTELNSLKISNEDLKLEGIHPEFGKVNLAQLLSTWAVHDLGHIAQITRVMAKQYKGEVGPWKKYLRILHN